MTQVKQLIANMVAEGAPIPPDAPDLNFSRGDTRALMQWIIDRFMNGTPESQETFLANLRSPKQPLLARMADVFDDMRQRDGEAAK